MAVVAFSGAEIVAFEGIVREVERLDYEACRELAEERIATMLVGAPSISFRSVWAPPHQVDPVALGEPAFQPARCRVASGEYLNTKTV